MKRCAGPGKAPGAHGRFMVSDVFFFDYSSGAEVLSGLQSVVERTGGLKEVTGSSSVAVKLHMGERGNTTYIRPVFVSKIVAQIKKRRGKPFVTDTVALYPGARSSQRKYLSTAASNGYVRQSVGAPIVIADGDGEDGVAIKLDKTVDNCRMKEVSIATKIYEADFLVALSHVKGHMITGFGGAIKNLGMGCVTRSAKREQHRMNPTLLEESKCDGCGACIDVCPTSALTLVEDRPGQDPETCIYCSTCLFACESSAWFWERANKLTFQVYLAHAAAAVMRCFEGRAVFVNLVQDVTPCCDCASPAGPPLIADVGILASTDPVAVDKASLDLVDKAPAIHSSFPERGRDRFGLLHGTDSLVQLRTAERLGLGSLAYRLIGV